MRAVAAALVVALAFVACGGDGAATIKLDGSPRISDDEGVATTITRSRIVLDGERTYTVDDDFVSFSTYTGEVQPMIARRGQYVQLGLDGKQAIWMAGIAAVVPGTPAAVFYIGRLRRIDDERRAIFADGTVLKLGRGVGAPAGKPERVQARIDPAQHAVVELVAS